jgi:hypothetical protein
MPLFSRHPRPQPSESPETIAATRAWIEAQVCTPEGYRFAPGCPTTLLATCFGVLAHELLGGLDGLAAERRQLLVRSICDCQSPSSGLFRDRLHGDDQLYKLVKFTPLYVEWQQTYFALHALDALGAEPRHPLAFVEPFRDPAALDTWLRMLAFDDFWFSSNYVMFLLFFLIREHGKSSPAAHRVLDALDARQDPQTGFWGTQQGASLFNGMAGAYHVYGFYRFLGRPLAHQDAALRSTLSLQKASGLFGEREGGACEDLDAIDILVKLRPESAAREREVRGALERSLEGLRACRRADGGYSWSSAQRGAAPRTVRYSGLDTLTVRSDQSDLWSAWFRPLALALARSRLELPEAWPVRYRRVPLLGWHDPVK